MYIYLSIFQVRRIDPCEICLCVDGEIFCWWKKCGKTFTDSVNEIGGDRQCRKEKEHQQVRFPQTITFRRASIYTV